jgi:hypothetical protein
MNERPTPETNAVRKWAADFSKFLLVVPCDHAERLERERDEAREQTEKMREAIREAHGTVCELIRFGHLPECALLNFAGLNCDCGHDEALALCSKLQPFLP